MGFLGNLLGITPNSGMNFKASGTDIQQPVTADQVNQANAATQAALLQQQGGLGLGQQQLGNTQGFLDALQAQNGIGNQSNVFGQQQGLAQALAGQLGQNSYGGLQNQQQALANQYAQIAQGQGPNPAQAQLAQATGANNAQTAALLAGQRNAGSNAGLVGRQIAEQQGANQQNLAGQAATLQAQQSLTALGQQGAQQQAIGNTIGQGVNQNLAYTQALQNQQNALAGNAQNQVSNQAGALGLNQNATNSQTGALQGLTGATQGQQGLLQQGLGAQNNANVAMQSNINNANANIQGTVAQGQQSLLGGAIGALGAIPGLSALKTVGTALAAHGGMIGDPNVPKTHAVVDYLKNMKKGGNVPGTASVKGDSYANDTVPAMLSPGEIVVPRHILEGKDPVKNAGLFVAKALAKKGIKR